MRRFTLTPYLVWMVLFTVVPMLLVLYYAFSVPTAGGTTWSLENFSRFFEPIYLRVFLRSLSLAVISTATGSRRVVAISVFATFISNTVFTPTTYSVLPAVSVLASRQPSSRLSSDSRMLMV